MRIRKGQARGSNSRARGESHFSGALAAAGSQDQPPDKTNEPLPVEDRSRARTAEILESIPERVVVRSEEPPSPLAALHTSAKRSPIPPERSYMNLDEFVNSLARTNVFSEEEFRNPHSVHHRTEGESSGFIKQIPGPGGDQFIPHFSREDSRSSLGSADDVDTSLRLAISPRKKAPAPDPSEREKGVIIVDAEVAGSSRRLYGAGTSVDREVRIESTLETGRNIIAGDELCRQSSHVPAQTTSIPESTEVVEAGQPDQAMKSPTESIELERRPRRVSTSAGRKSGRLPSPAAAEEEETDDIDQEEEESSDHSSQRAKSRKRKRKRTLVSVSSSTLAIQDSGKRKQKQELKESGAGESASKRTKTKKERKTTNSRSGRPKRLKYMKQENTEELGNQCNRSDGKGWTCPLLAKTGYQLCDHHLDKLRCKPGSRSKYNKKKKGATTLS